MTKIVVAVGFDFPGGAIECISVDSDRSLLDADIIIFRPDISDFPDEQTHLGKRRTYQGERWLSEQGSFALKRAERHWSSQLQIAYEANKTIIVFSPAYEGVYVDTGKREHSGTGRNRQTTVMLSNADNYSLLPIRLTVTTGVGTGIRAASDLGALTPLWNFLKDHFEYKVMFEGDSLNPILFTRTGEKIVGGLVTGKGVMVFFPDIKLDRKTFITESGAWSKAAKQFGQQLLALIIEADKAFRSGKEVTPTPTWANASEFQFKAENDIRDSILSLDKKIEGLTAERQAEQERLASAGFLRALLFEKGLRLERAVREALRLLGFQAENFKDREHEFDAIFDSSEGRVIGEVEGRDQKGIAIEKLSQLERNIQEDFAREGVNAYAKGVLFGNAERLVPVEQRGPFFTDKVISGARRSKIALIRTPDLFEIVRYLKETPDSDFAQKCREAIATNDGGVVIFPKIESRSTKQATLKNPG